MNLFNLEIVTPTRKVFEEQVYQVNAPTIEGVVGILANHASLLTALKEGEIKIVTPQKELFLAIGGGFLQVGDNKVRILVSKAKYADELNENEIEEAINSAKKILSEKTDPGELRDAQAVLRRSMWELKVLKKRSQIRRV